MMSGWQHFCLKSQETKQCSLIPTDAYMDKQVISRPTFYTSITKIKNTNNIRKFVKSITAQTFFHIYIVWKDVNLILIKQKAPNNSQQKSLLTVDN